jgi:hypothetical protein
MDRATPLALRHHLRDLPDPRTGQCTHDFLDIITIAICATVCGQQSWTDMDLYGEAHRDWLRTFLRLPSGIPSHTTCTGFWMWCSTRTGVDRGRGTGRRTWCGCGG